MNRRATVILTALCTLFISVMLLTAPVFAGDRPSLVEEIRNVIDSDGVDAAKQRFAEVYPSQKDAYDIDMQAMALLGQEYITAGDMNAGMAVMEMSSAFAQDMVNQMYAADTQAGEMMRQMAEQEKVARAQQEKEQAGIREQEQQQQQKSLQQSRGKAREDLQRFTGMFTDPDRANRTLFVTVSCDGFLVAGPMWADVSPWWMRSAADTVFTYSDSFMSFSMEFETGADGRGQAIRHDLDGIGSPVERTGPLPGDWEECMERPRR